MMQPTEQRADGRPDDRAELHRRGRACALQRRHASRQQAERARVKRRLANAHQQAQQDQHDETAGEAVCRSRETPEQKSTAQYARRTVAIREPAHHGLHRRVRPVEGRQDPAHLARGETQLLLEQGRRGRDAAAIDVVDEQRNGQERHEPDRCSCEVGPVRHGARRFSDQGGSTPTWSACSSASPRGTCRRPGQTACVPGKAGSGRRDRSSSRR